MECKRTRINIREMISFVAVMFTVLMSKTYYFGILNRRTIQYIYYAMVILAVLVCGYYRKYLRAGFSRWLCLTIFLIANLLLHISEMNFSEINQVLGMIFNILFAWVTCSCVLPDSFSKWYIRIIEMLAVISLPCVAIANLDPGLAMSLCQPGYNWQQAVGYSLLYTWGTHGIITHRNSGPFWEPGAFQGFLVLAMLMLLYQVDAGTVKHRKFALILILITVLTTQSSTGYVILIILILMQWERIEQVFQKKSKWARNIAGALIAVATLYIIISSNNIAIKLSGSETESASVRFADVFGGLAMTAKSGFFGLGETSLRDTYRMIFRVNHDDSAGLLAMTYTYGWLFSFTYVITMLSGIKHFFNPQSKKDIVCLVIVFLILHLTEDLWYLPVYLVIIFYQKDKAQHMEPCVKEKNELYLHQYLEKE